MCPPSVEAQLTTLPSVPLPLISDRTSLGKHPLSRRLAAVDSHMPQPPQRRPRIARRKMATASEARSCSDFGKIPNGAVAKAGVALCESGTDQLLENGL